MADPAVLERLRKLLARTIENGCSENEAAKAASAAAKLMAEHALTEADAAEAQAEISVLRVPVPSPDMVSEAWHMSLVNVVGRMFGVVGLVGAVDQTGQAWPWAGFAGDQTGAMCACATYEWLRDTGLSLSDKRQQEREERRLARDGDTPAWARIYVPHHARIDRNGYMFGYVQAVHARILAESAEDQRGAAAPGSGDGPSAEAPKKTGSEIVHDRHVAVLDEVKKRGLQEGKPRTSFVDFESMNAGYMDGSKVPINKADGLTQQNAPPAD